MPGTVLSTWITNLISQQPYQVETYHYQHPHFINEKAELVCSTGPLPTGQGRHSCYVWFSPSPRESKIPSHTLEQCNERKWHWVSLGKERRPRGMSSVRNGLGKVDLLIDLRPMCLRWALDPLAHTTLNIWTELVAKDLAKATQLDSCRLALNPISSVSPWMPICPTLPWPHLFSHLQSRGAVLVLVGSLAVVTDVNIYWVFTLCQAQASGYLGWQVRSLSKASKAGTLVA